MSLIVRKLPMRLGWWDAPLMLRNLPKAIHMILTMGGSPFCSHGSFWAMMGHDSAFPVGPFLNDFQRHLQLPPNHNSSSARTCYIAPPFSPHSILPHSHPKGTCSFNRYLQQIPVFLIKQN